MQIAGDLHLEVRSPSICELIIAVEDAATLQRDHFPIANSHRHCPATVLDD
ncbi:MAG: hypothetical protein JO345_34935 [Streptosporangiaceae bacterium]|nr:hypothetical protein [Streptosporangiaceae bacterium]